MAARAGVEPTTLRLRVIASTNAPPCPRLNSYSAPADLLEIDDEYGSVIDTSSVGELEMKSDRGSRKGKTEWWSVERVGEEFAKVCGLGGLQEIVG